MSQNNEQEHTEYFNIDSTYEGPLNRRHSRLFRFKLVLYNLMFSQYCSRYPDSCLDKKLAAQSDKPREKLLLELTKTFNLEKPFDEF